jgi:hypothetical protein
MDENIIPLMGILCAVGLPLVLAIVATSMSIKTKHEERMKLIENGMPLDQPEAPRRNPNRFSALRNGLVLIGFSIGLIIGLCIMPYIPDESDFADLAVPAVTVLFGGIAYVIYFLIARKLEAKESEAEKKLDEPRKFEV